jgi:hypothetical protein
MEGLIFSTVAMDYDLPLKFKVNQCRFKYLHHTPANMRWGGLSDSSWKIGRRETLEIKINIFLSINCATSFII